MKNKKEIFSTLGKNNLEDRVLDYFSAAGKTRSAEYDHMTLF